MTRVDDRAVELGQRPEIATRASADLLVSIHFNSVEKDVARVSGTETYTMTPQSQRSTSDSMGTIYDSVSDPAATNPGNVNDHWNAVLGYEMHRALLSELKTFRPRHETRTPRGPALGDLPGGAGGVGLICPTTRKPRKSPRRLSPEDC